MNNMDDFDKLDIRRENRSPGSPESPKEVSPKAEDHAPAGGWIKDFSLLGTWNRISALFKQGIKKIRERKKPEISERDTWDDTSEEEIIFPMHEEGNDSPFGKRKTTHGFLKGVGVTALILFVFFLGFFTQPDMMEKATRQIKEWASVALEKSGPIGDRVYEKTTELIEKKLPEKKKAVPAVPQTLPDQEGKTERKIKYWQAPMNPSYISDKPGKSPMGMDLVPVYEDEVGSGNGIRISPTMVQNIGVKTEKIRKRTLTREIRTIGRLTYDERLVTHIHTKYEGWIEKLHVDFTGQEVNEEDLLLEIYSPELVSTQEELLLAMKYNESLKESPFTDIGKGAQSLLDSTRRRLELFDVPEHQIEGLIRDKKITKTMHIHSPVRGFVIKKPASQGMYVKPGMSLYTISDLSNIWVLADIYEYELPWIKIGQKVKMTLSYYPGRIFKGKITYIDPFLESKTRTIKVRMEFDNPKWELKPDMYANVVLKSVIAKRAIAVPEAAVIRSGERNLIIVKTPKGGFESKEITLGAQANDYIQVLKGLRAGEEVVTSSSFLIDSESRLKEALSKMQESRTGSVKGKTPVVPGVLNLQPEK